MSIRNGITVRGTSNGNERGSAEARRRRKLFLLETYRADQDLLLTTTGRVFGSIAVGEEAEEWAACCDRVQACRCYRCGRLLHFETLTVDRIQPGCRGGTYRRENIRPACGPCNSETGGALKGDSKNVPASASRRPASSPGGDSSSPKAGAGTPDDARRSA